MHPLGQATASERSERQRQFRAAAALAGRSLKSLAEEWGVNDNHLYLVLRGSRESRRLTQAIDGFIAQHLPEAGTEVGRG